MRSNREIALKLLLILVLSMFTAACGKTSESSENFSRGIGSQVEAYDMKDGVRCYLYIGRSISCLQIRVGNHD